MAIIDTNPPSLTSYRVVAGRQIPNRGWLAGPQNVSYELRRDLPDQAATFRYKAALCRRPRLCHKGRRWHRMLALLDGDLPELTVTSLGAR
jgi:hypothetical protein